MAMLVGAFHGMRTRLKRSPALAFFSSREWEMAREGPRYCPSWWECNCAVLWVLCRN